MDKNLIDLFIERYGPETKARDGKNSRHTCPKCKGNSLACHLYTGCAKCWHCDFIEWSKGVPSTQAESPVDHELQVKITEKILEISELQDSHKEYLVKRGIYNPELYQIRTSPNQLDKRLLESFTADELERGGFFTKYENSDNYCVSKSLLARRIIIPHWQGDKIITYKSRIRPYTDPEQENEPRYIAPRGSNVGRNLWWKGDLGKDAIVTEGELCAMATTQAGITTCGLPGLKASQNVSVLNQLKTLVDKSGTERLFIILDTDSGIKNDAEKLKCSINIKRVIGAKACILYVPQDFDDENMDLDLYLSRYDVSDLYDLMEDAWAKKEPAYRGLMSRVRHLNERRKGNHQAS